MSKTSWYSGNELYAWVGLCYNDPEFVREYDKLHGTDLCRQGSTLDLLIDDSTERSTSDLHGFVKFCALILEHLPEEARAELRTVANTL